MLKVITLGTLLRNAACRDHWCYIQTFRAAGHKTQDHSGEKKKKGGGGLMNISQVFKTRTFTLCCLSPATQRSLERGCSTPHDAGDSQKVSRKLQNPFYYPS